MRRRRSSYKFTEKTHSKKALVSGMMAAASLIMYLVFIFLSYNAGGQLSAYYGSFGFLAMIIALTALSMSIPTLKEEDSFLLFPRIAVAESSLATLLWVGTYILGIMRG